MTFYTTKFIEIYKCTLYADGTRAVRKKTLRLTINKKPASKIIYRLSLFFNIVAIKLCWIQHSRPHKIILAHPSPSPPTLTGISLKHLASVAFPFRTPSANSIIFPPLVVGISLKHLTRIVSFLRTSTVNSLCNYLQSLHAFSFKQYFFFYHLRS